MTVAEDEVLPVKIPVDNEPMICQCPVSGLPVRGGAQETGQRSAHRQHLLRGGPGDRGSGPPVDEAPFPDRVGGQRQRDAGKVARDRQEPAFRLRVEVAKSAGVEKRRVEMVRDVEHAVDGQVAGESLEQRDRRIQEPQPGFSCPGRRGRSTVNVPSGEERTSQLITSIRKEDSSVKGPMGRRGWKGASCRRASRRRRSRVSSPA